MVTALSGGAREPNASGKIAVMGTAAAGSTKYNRRLRGGLRHDLACH
jgi:hypothetical protein